MTVEVPKARATYSPRFVQWREGFGENHRYLKRSSTVILEDHALMATICVRLETR